MKMLKIVLFLFSTHKKLHNDVVLDGNVYCARGQAA